MNCKSLMREKLPEHIYRLLKDIGRTGDRTDYPVFVVGGFVRDLLIDQPNLDVDIVVEGDGIDFAYIFAEAKKGVVKRHQRFGTAVVTLPDKFKIDVASARTEVYDHPGALPSVRFSSHKDDLYRRDFTINAMAIELNENRFGDLVDFFGGRSDLQSGTVRILHDLSFEDDPTRILRAVRFEQRYGFSIEPYTEKLLRKATAGGFLKKITGQRLRNEILLILKEGNPVPAIQRMAHFDLVKYIHPRICVSHELVELFGRIEGVLTWWNSVHGKADLILLNLLALLDQLNAVETEDVSERLALKKKYDEALKISKTRLPSIFERMGETKNPPSQVYEILNGLPLEVLLFAVAKTDAVRDDISSYLTQLRKIKSLVNGNDLRSLGYSEGPLYTQILDRTFAAQLDGVVVDKNQAVQFIENRFPL